MSSSIARIAAVGSAVNITIDIHAREFVIHMACDNRVTLEFPLTFSPCQNCEVPPVLQQVAAKKDYC